MRVLYTGLTALTIALSVTAFNVSKGKNHIRTFPSWYFNDNLLSLHTNYNRALLARPTKEGIGLTPLEEPARSVDEDGKNRKSNDDTTLMTAEEKSNPQSVKQPSPVKEEVPKPITAEFNVVLTHCTSDFDSLASAVGLSKLWSTRHPSSVSSSDSVSSSEFESSTALPTFVVLPRGAHPAVQKFLALHKHLFPIRSLRSLQNDLSGLNRLGLVDAQRRDRIGPAEHLLSYAKRVTIVDHHIDGESDIPEATDYVVEGVGSVSTMVAERLRDAKIELTEAEATLLALGIHADTGSLCFDSTTTRDAEALAWTMGQGASQAAIAEHAHSSLSQEQQGVLTNALVNANSTMVYGVTVSSVLLRADGFINGLAAVTQDALELSSSDVFLLAVVYDPKRKVGRNRQSELFAAKLEESSHRYGMMEEEAWKGGEQALRKRRLKAAFDQKDIDGNGYLERNEIVSSFIKSRVIISEDAFNSSFKSIDIDGDGRLNFDEFVIFAETIRGIQNEQEKLTGKKPTTMTVIGRVKPGVNMKDVNLNRLFQRFGGGGHAKAASCTVRLDDESEAGQIVQGLVDNLIATGLMAQATVGDFMTSPVLSAKPKMTEKQVEDLFNRYDVRALPVVDDNNDVIGLVTYKEVAAAKQRLWNKEQKRMREMAKSEDKGDTGNRGGNSSNRKLGSALKGWMKQHVQVVESSRTMAEVEAILLENDVGCMPVVEDGTKQLIGMVTRTDLLRQHRYYPSLHYHNKGFADSIAARKPIIELRKKLKKFDMDE